MRLLPTPIPKWPKLAWVARLTPGSPTVEVLHGPMVETGDGWVVEAVWAGEFADGGFDRTELVFGSGARCREDKVIFVSAGHLQSRLWDYSAGETHFVSNSLPALTALAGVSLRDDYADYSRDIRSIARGLKNYVRLLPVSTGEVRVTYFNNLAYDGTRLAEVEKPDTAPTFSTFEDYRRFMVHTAERLGENIRSSARSHEVIPLAAISRGYDSAASSVIVRHAGCTHTVTIRQSTSMWRGSDSGEHVAQKLGLSCRSYNRTAKSYPLEYALWAGEGRPGVLNWTLFDYPEPLCVFFTGCGGRKVWSRALEDPDPSVRHDAEAVGFCEFRLLKGVFHCSVPFWGARHIQELRVITLSEEMTPWRTRRSYDKPIARRILEEAGVPRDAFGMRKKNTSHEAPFLWPYTPEYREHYQEYLRSHGVDAPSPFWIDVIRRAALLEHLLHRNVIGKLGVARRFRPWRRLSEKLFHWANYELKQLYEAGLREVATGKVGTFQPSGSRAGESPQPFSLERR